MIMLCLFIVSLLVTLSSTDSGGYAQEYQPSNYDGEGEEYGYDHQCNCNEICSGQEPEDWEFEYEEVPSCIIDNCGQQLDTCAASDSCIEGIEGVVSSCYADNEDPMQCMDGLVQDTENNGFNQLCDGNEECGADLQALGECVVNSANYGFCSEDEYKKIKLKSVLKTIKKRSRKLKRKSAAKKQKSKRSKKSKKVKKGKKGKKGKKSNKAKKSKKGKKAEATTRRLQEDVDVSDDENPEYDYGCYCDCGDEEEEIPPCIIDNCGQQLFECGSSEDCASGIEGVIATCYEDNDNPQECMDELIKESNGDQAIALCNNNEEAAGDLQALGDCVINSANYGFCTEDEFKKLKVTALVKATKKVRARRVASKQRKARSVRRARSARAQRRRQRKVRKQRARPRSRVETQRLAKSQRATSQRARKVKSRKSRRKLQSSQGGCCECQNSSGSPGCNEECDNTICSYDPYCCNEDYGSWDWICAAAAVDECNGDNDQDGDDWNYEYDYYEPPTASSECCECTDSSDSPFCNDGCDANICSYDPYCCNVQWDWICANSAKDECAASGNTFEGEETNPPPGDDESCCDCTESEDGVGCSANPECDSIVCPLDSYCCNVNWDGICANGANNICNAVDYWSWEQTTNYNDYDDSWYQDSYDTYNDGTTGSCCECTSDSDGPGCNAVCDNEVCPLDSYCCNNKWDWICANGANSICQGYDYYNSGSGGYDSYQDYTPSYYFNYGYSNYEPYDYSANYDYGSYSYYSPSGDFTYSDEPYYNSEEYSYSDYQPYDSYNYGFEDSFNNYEPNSYDYSFYDSYNNYQPYDYSDNYDYGSYSYYSPSPTLDFTYSEKKVGARKVASKQTKARSVRRAISARGQRRRQRKQRVRPRSKVEAQRLSKSQRARARSQRSRKQRSQKVRKSRRKLQSSEGGCCECQNSSGSPGCNEECDNTICSYDPYCCNEDYGSWDWICAAAAVDECNGDDNEDGEDWNYEYDYYEPPTASGECCECTDSSDSPFCNDGCDANICSYDPYCCNVQWDWICANSAKDECAASGNTFEGEETNPPPGDDESCCDCTQSENGVGCSSNPECDSIVCPLDSYCCNVNWDGICANGANNICNAVDYWSWEQTTNYDYDDSWYQDSYDTYNDGTTGSCCECTSSMDGPGCNAVCDNEVCPLDSYCCNNQWDWICANGANNICQGYDYFNSGGSNGYDSYQDSYDFNYGYSNYEPYDFSPSYDAYDSFNNYEPYYGTNSYDSYSPAPEQYSYYDDYQYEYGYDDQCNCDEICHGQEPEDWEFEYEEVPPCIINNCGQQLDTCAASDPCIEGIEGMVSSCYADNEDPTQCMDGLVQDTENNGFTQLCDGNEECGADLQSLGECVVNSANYGFCPEEEYKKLKLKSVLKTVKKRSRKLKRKSVAAKQKSKRSRKLRKSERSKKRGKRASKLRQSRRKLQDGSSDDYYYNDYENPEYDYGCYCDCGDEEEEIPQCIIDNCGEQLYACGESEDCINGVEGVVQQCYEDNDTPQECMDELMQESNGEQAIELCNGNEEAAADLQALGTCVINSANYGFCTEDEYKKLKIKALVKATKKVRARKVASKQRKARSLQRAKSLKARSQKHRQRKVRSQRSRKVRPRGRRSVAQRQRQRRVRSQRTSRRPRKLRRRRRQTKRQRN